VGASRQAFAGSMALVAMLLAAGLIAMAISVQSGATRSIYAAVALGRYAGELAESAVDEALAEFTPTMSGRLPSPDMRSHLLRQATGGKVDGRAILGSDGFAFSPARTLELIREGRIGVKVSDVGVRLLFYSTVQNYGQVDLTCHATYRHGGGRELFRRGTSRHYFVLDADGKTFRVNPVACSFLVDRSSDS